MLHEDQMQDDDADDEPKKTAPLDRILEDCYRVIFACSYGRYAP